VLRDRRADARLEALGWEVVRVWEHEDPVEAGDRVEEAVRAGQRRQAPTSSSAIS
jgi:DNA mismatch endonuclease (patch repair protein)